MCFPHIYTMIYLFLFHSICSFFISFTELIDCDNYNFACCGGRPHATFLYLNKTGGAELDKTYNGRTFLRRCHFQPQNVKAKVVGIVLFANSSVAANERIIEQYVAEKGPVVVNLTPGGLTVSKVMMVR